MRKQLFTVLCQDVDQDDRLFIATGFSNSIWPSDTLEDLELFIANVAPMWEGKRTHKIYAVVEASAARVHYKATFPKYPTLAPVYKHTMEEMKEHLDGFGKKNPDISEENRLWWEDVAKNAVIERVTEITEVIPWE